MAIFTVALTFCVNFFWAGIWLKWLTTKSFIGCKISRTSIGQPPLNSWSWDHLITNSNIGPENPLVVQMVCSASGSRESVLFQQSNKIWNPLYLTNTNGNIQKRYRPQRMNRHPGFPLMNATIKLIPKPLHESSGANTFQSAHRSWCQCYWNIWFFWKMCIRWLQNVRWKRKEDLQKLPNCLSQ